MGNFVNRKIKLLSFILSILSLFAVIPIMFPFYKQTTLNITFGVYGYKLYASETVYIIMGVFGLVALLWDLAFGAFAVIDGKYNPLIWKIARYGYFYGAAVSIINLLGILSVLISYQNCTAGSIIFLVMIAAITIAKINLIFTKEKMTETNNLNT